MGETLRIISKMNAPGDNAEKDGSTATEQADGRHNDRRERRELDTAASQGLTARSEPW